MAAIPQFTHQIIDDCSMATCKPLMNALRRVGLSPGSATEMSDTDPQPSTAKASVKVENLQKSYDYICTTLAEDDPLVKQCLENLEKARKQSDAQAQLVDEKHVTEALIQTNKFLASTTEAFAKGDKAEQDRLAELKKAVEEQEAFIAKRASDCSSFLQQVHATFAQLDAMKVHLLAKSKQTDQPESPPVVQEVIPQVPSDKLEELHKILAEVKLPPEIAKKLREDVTAVLAPPPIASTYGKASSGATPAAQVAHVGPYQQVPLENKDKKAEADHKDSDTQK